MNSIFIFIHNFKQFLIAIDQLINTVIGLFFLQERFYADETLSAHAYRYEQEQGILWLRKWIDRIFFFDRNHCKESFENEILRQQSPVSERCKCKN